MLQTGKKRIIVVLGVHRSGTSAVTRGLKVLGVELGNNLVPAGPDNTRGFWEDFDLNALNIEMLAAIGSDWHYLEPIAAGDFEILRSKGYFDRAAAWLREKVRGVYIFGCKDPRLAKLAPFWKEVFRHCNFDVSYILVVRHPLSVAKSLAERDGFDVVKCYLLWLEHVLISVASTTDERRVFVDYDRMMQSPDHEINRIAERLDLSIDPTELQYYKREFLDTKLRHTVYSPKDLALDDACPPLVREIYAAVSDMAADSAHYEHLIWNERVLQWMEEFDRMTSLLSLADRLLRRISNLSRAIKEMEKVTIALDAERRAREMERAEAVKQIQSLTDWATSADTYAKSKVEEMETLRGTAEAVRHAQEVELGKMAAKVQMLESQLMAYRSHWVFRILPVPPPMVRKS